MNCLRLIISNPCDREQPRKYLYLYNSCEIFHDDFIATKYNSCITVDSKLQKQP